MKYKAVLFDLDGTVLDTSDGIVHCYNATAKKFGYPVRPKEEFRTIIGGALPNNFIKYFGFDESNVREAVEYYREEYAKTGIHMAAYYPDMVCLLNTLKKNKIKTAIATLKREDFAKKIMTEFKLSPYLDKICGMDQGDTKTKASIILDCIDFLNINKNDAVMVGDSLSDYYGAKECGIDFIGVTYGWGFGSNINELYPHMLCVNSVKELAIALKCPENPILV